MDGGKKKKTVFSYIYIVLLFIAAFIEDNSTNVIISIIVSVLSLCFCGIFLRRSNKKIRWIPICILSAIGIINSFDYLFLFLPFMLMFVGINDYIDEDNRNLSIDITVLAVTLVTEAVMLFVLKGPVLVHNRLFSISITAMLVMFAAAEVYYIKKSGLFDYKRKVKKIRKSRKISKANQNIISEYKKIGVGAIFGGMNILFTVGILAYCFEKDFCYALSTFSVLMWIFYLVYFVKNIVGIYRTDTEQKA